MSQQPFSISREVILGVGGGIAAYKSCDLVRRLKDHGFLVTVIPTRSSLNFIGSATWEALSGRPVQSELWNNVHEVPHISMARKADAIVIAPATADLIARIASGRADDLLTNVVLASSSPLILVPAMHSEMWLNPATVSNVETLRKRGVTVIDPAIGNLSSGDKGIGRYPETSEIVQTLNDVLHQSSDLLNRKILISAGGTREMIDPVRYIGNNSSGKQGIALAIDAASRGAKVSLVIANAPDVYVEGIEIVHVSSAIEMFDAMDSRFSDSDIVVMSAAVADVRPATNSQEKIIKSELQSLTLTENPDIIATLSARKTAKQVIVGFAAQTGSEWLDNGRAKLASKKLDLVYVNNVSGGAIFGKEKTSGVIINSNGTDTSIEEMSKLALAHKLLTLAIEKLG